MARNFVVWILIMAAETVHGILRVLFLQPYVGDFRARQLAVFTGSILILLIATAFIRWLGASATRTLIWIGLFWLGLTVSFELVLGRVILGLPWERLAADYNLLEGGLLPFGLLVLATSPLLARKLRGMREPQK